MERVIGLAGRRGSGKTTVARGLARHGYRTTSFGDIVRRETAALGLSITTENLQSVGNDLIVTWGWERFCDEVIDTVQDSSLVVVDGFRHAAPVQHFRDRFNDRFKLTFLDVDEDVRIARLRGREEYDARRDHHPVELEVDELRVLADVVVASDNEAVRNILRAISRSDERNQ